MPRKPIKIPAEFIRVFFSFFVKKCPKIVAAIGATDIKIAAKLLWTLTMPYEIKKNGRTRLTKAIPANNFHSEPRKLILIFFK